MASVLDNFANNCTGTVQSGGLANLNNPAAFSVGASDLQDLGGNPLQPPFSLTVWDSATYGQNPKADPNVEIVYVLARAGAMLSNVLRGQEGTTPNTHPTTATPTCAAMATAAYINTALCVLDDITHPMNQEIVVNDRPHSSLSVLYQQRQNASYDLLQSYMML